MAVFAIGEMLMLPAVPGSCNDPASDRTRGRHNAINYAAFQFGAFAGPDLTRAPPAAFAG